MGIIIDIILLIIAAIIIVFCWKNGFVKSVLGLACNVVAVVAAYAFTPAVSEFICERFFLDKVSSAIAATVRSAASSEAGVNVGSFLTEIPNSLQGTLEKFNISDDALQGFISKTMPEAGEDGVRSVADYIAEPTSRMLSNAVAFVLIFVVSLIVLRLVSKLILVIFKAPIIEKVDKTAGLILGVFNALIILFALSLAAATAVRALGTYLPKEFEGAVEQSVILRLFSSVNPMSLLNNVLQSN
ncbi:MAG: CvpA family protein [Clostridia bacterium]|nr:CvpA family protein [Clostridia bacterium]